MRVQLAEVACPLPARAGHRARQGFFARTNGPISQADPSTPVSTNLCATPEATSRLPPGRPDR